MVPLTELASCFVFPSEALDSSSKIKQVKAAAIELKIDS